LKKSIQIIFCLFTACLLSVSAYGASLKIGVLPIVDALPFYVAKQNNLFRKNSVDVSIIPFRSAVERDAAFQAGKLNAYLGDLVSASLLRGRGFHLKVVSVILGMHPGEGLFAILAAPQAPLHSLRDLKGRSIAISSNTIIEYVLDSLLKQHGIPAGMVNKKEIKSIPIRFQMLMSGKIEAAVLPDPLASLARFKGAKWLTDDGQTNLSQTVLIWRTEFLAQHPKIVKEFYRGYNAAVKIINQNHDAVRPLLVRKCRLPKPIASSFQFANFPRASAPDKAWLRNVIVWLKNKGLLKHPLKAETLTMPKGYLKSK